MCVEFYREARHAHETRNMDARKRRGDCEEIQREEWVTGVRRNYLRFCEYGGWREVI